MKISQQFQDKKMKDFLLEFFIIFGYAFVETLGALYFFVRMQYGIAVGFVFGMSIGYLTLFILGLIILFKEWLIKRGI